MNFLTGLADIAPDGSIIVPDSMHLAARVGMEGRQRNFLTRFMDYSSWNKIHLFLDYCTSGKEHLVGSVCGDLDYQTQDEEMTNGCMNLIARIKAFLKEHLGEKTEISTLITA